MIESKIPIEVLRSVKTIVTHAHCPDGLASAILLHDVLPKAEILFLTHDQLATLPATEGILFCDIAPAEARADDFRIANAVVLDHHKTAKAVVTAFAGDHLGVYADNEAEPGVSGAVLAFRHAWLPLQRIPSSREGRAEQFATLIGIRDTFDKRNEILWEEAWHLSAGLMFDSDFLDISDPFGPANGWMEATVQLGQAVCEHNGRRAERALSEGFGWITPKGRSVLITQGLDLTTLLGEMVAATGKFDMIIGFAYRTDPATAQPRFQVSMRSQGVVDVAAIAKLHGGGGHTNAAGFTLNWLTELNPIDTIRNLLERAGV